MAEKDFFYNALPDASSVTGYDRNYNADDLSEWLATVWETGVVKSDEGLKVVEASGMTVNVNAGKACILGKPYNNTSLKALTVATAPTGSTARYDLVVLQYNNEVGTRHTRLLIKQNASITGLSTDEDIKNTLTRSGRIFEICLAVIQVDPNATSIPQSKIYDKRGNATLCPWFTAVKGYDEYYDAMVQSFEYTETLASLTKTVQTNIASRLFIEKYSQVEVFTNGLKEPSSAYSVSTSGAFIVITFTANRSAGAVVNVRLDNYIDGEGMSTALAQYSQWANAVATLQTANEYNYFCNGVNDNVVISDYVNTRLANENYNGAIVLNIIGNLGATAPMSGDGSTASPYVWFDFNIDASRKVILDFTRARSFTPNTTSGKRYYLFKSVVDLFVKRLNVVVYNNNAGTSVQVFEVKNVTAENCNFFINAYQDSYISEKGTFSNCEGYVANTINNSFCFNNQAKLRLDGGSYRAYCTSGYKSAVVGQLFSGSLSIIFGIDAPRISVSGYSQTNAIYATTGHIDCTALNSDLTVTKAFGEVRNTITQSQAP